MYPGENPDAGEKKSESTGFKEEASPMDLSSSGEWDFFATDISG